MGNEERDEERERNWNVLCEFNWTLKNLWDGFSVEFGWVSRFGEYKLDFVQGMITNKFSKKNYKLAN